MMITEEISMFLFFDEKESHIAKYPLIKKIIYHNLLSPYKFIEHNDIEIHKSSLHGNGLFATANIPANSIITFYPAHILIWNSKKFYGHKKYKNIQARQKLTNYMFKLSDKVDIMGDPKIAHNKLLLGHFINDSSVLNIDDDIDTIESSNDLKIKIKNSILNYVIYSQNNSTLKFNDTYGVAYILSKKNINTGDEITMSYLPYYWFAMKTKYNVKIIDIFLEAMNDTNLLKIIVQNKDNF